ICSRWNAARCRALRFPAPAQPYSRFRHVLAFPGALVAGIIPGASARAVASAGLVGLAEKTLRELGLLFERSLPAVTRFFLLAEALQNMPQIEERFRENCPLFDCFAIQPRCVIQMPAL